MKLSATAGELLRRWSRCTWVDGPVLEVPLDRRADALELLGHRFVQGLIGSDNLIPMTPDGVALAREMRLQAFGNADQ